MYTGILDSFSKNNDYCKEKKTRLSHLQATGVFLLIDLDDSGELEPEEILDVFMDRKLLGQSREEQAKQDAMAMVWKSWAQLKVFCNELSGYWDDFTFNLFN